MFDPESAELFVEKLRITCILGDLPHERTEPQTIELDLLAKLDLRVAKLTEQIEDSVDYVALSALAVTIAQEGEFRLVETLASQIAQTALAKWARLSQITVRVRKFGCVPNTGSCGIVVSARQKN